MENKILNFIGIIAVVATAIWAFNTTKGKDMTTGIKIENMNTAVLPGDNFYEYANGGWTRANPIPDDYSRYGMWQKIDETTMMRVREMAEKDTGKIGTLYRIAMNSDKRNADGIAPVAAHFADIDAIKSRDDLAAYLGTMHRFASAFWGDGVALDEKDSEHFLYNIGQGGIGLSRDYFFDTDEKSVQVRKKYVEYIEKILRKFNIDGNAKTIYDLEHRMAKSFHKKELLRDPHANYHKIARENIATEFPGFDWNAYFDARDANPKNINIGQPNAIRESIAIMNDTDLDLLRAYLKYRIASGATALLDDEAYEIAFDFYNRTIAGQITPKPRWKRAVAMLDGTLGEMIGQLYVKKYFPESAKKRMEALVENLRRAYSDRISNLEWMSDETRGRALEKLAGFKAKIGYPDKWRDYSKLDIREDSLYENMMRAAMFEDDFWIGKIDGPNDPTLWYMNAHEINAYYDPSTNEICFPAGILQYPFFDMDADDAFNYGAIGAIIGHEMTHGFDDQGRQFDTRGNLHDWWTPADADGFSARADVMRRFFDSIAITDEIHANGEFTLGENLADYGGVTIAYDAYKKFGTPAGTDTQTGLTDDMRFFVAYANAWAQNSRRDEDIRLTKIDVHSLPINRVNGILPHISAWYDAFNVTPESKMYVAPDKRVKLW